METIHFPSKYVFIFIFLLTYVFIRAIIVLSKRKEVKRMKVSELVRELKRAGCYKAREGSNHEIWKSPITNKKLQVPRHYSQELPPGTEQSIRRRAGL